MATTSPSVSEFQSLFPQWAATAEADVSRWFVQAALRFKAARFRAQWAMAVYLYTGHQLTLHNPDDADSNADDDVVRGALTSDKVGDLARSYESSLDMSRVPASLMHFTTTTYGRALVGIILSRSAARGRVIRTGASAAGSSSGSR